MEKTLEIKARSSLGAESSAEVPFVTGRHILPDEPPFTLNVYLGPDDGFTLRRIAIDAEKNLVYYGYVDSVEVSSEEKEVKITLKTQTVYLSFKIKE